MKRVVFFITHTTLSENHADMTLGSFARQTASDMFDSLYIYNSHEHELSNETIFAIIDKYELRSRFKIIEVFPYDPHTPKTLGSDLMRIKRFCIDNFEGEDRVLIIKSDTVLSVNFFDDILNVIPQTGPVYYVAPFICAKRRVSDEIIIEYSKRTKFIRSDDITFFVEDQHQSNDNDFHNRPNISVEDESILFTSCYVIRDFSCHYLSVSLLDHIQLREISWGGAWFSGLTPYFVGTDRAFVIHKYHNIISQNRTTEREGPVEHWLTS